MTKLSSSYLRKHCFGICFEYKNKITFNENTNNVEIERNNVFIAQILFDDFDGLTYIDHHVFLTIKQSANDDFERDPIPLNIYRSDANTARRFVLTVNDVWCLMKRKYEKAIFEPIQMS